MEPASKPRYPSAGRDPRQPIGVPFMLRKYCLQQLFGLSDEGLPDEINESKAMRAFIRIDLARERVPHATKLLKFRRLLEEHQLTAAIFGEITAHRAAHGLLLRRSTMVDATDTRLQPSLAIDHETSCMQSGRGAHTKAAQ
jgi:IS5 family transposase